MKLESEGMLRKRIANWRAKWIFSASLNQRLAVKSMHGRSVNKPFYFLRGNITIRCLSSPSTIFNKNVLNNNGG